MTVKEFKQLVAQIPDEQNDWIVVLSRDSEGNSFEELFEISKDEDEVCTQFFDEFSSELLSYEEDERGPYEDFISEIGEIYPYLKPCIVLWS